MSSTFNLTDNSTTFDLWNQEFALRASDGTFFVANTGDFGQLQGLATTTATVFATQLGASLILLIILLLITAPDKRRSLAFIFNALALVCNIIRCALFCAQVNGPFYNFMALELNDYQTPDIASAISESAACSLFSCFLFIFIELALILQIRVIYVAASGLRRALITYFSIVVALIAMGFRINLAVANVRNTIDVANASDEAFLQQQWAQRAANISAIVSIVLFSAIFCFKLAESIKSRRAMGLKQFGPIQIIFIMGCQTLLLPGESSCRSNIRANHVQSSLLSSRTSPFQAHNSSPSLKHLLLSSCHFLACGLPQTQTQSSSQAMLQVSLLCQRTTSTISRTWRFLLTP